MANIQDIISNTLSALFELIDPINGIKVNSTSSGGGTSTVAISQATPGTSNLVQLPNTQTVILGTGTSFIGNTSPNTFKASYSFNRPANTNSYSVGQAIANSASSPTNFSIDLSAAGAIAGQKFQIINCKVVSSANQSLLPQINAVIFNQSFTATNDGVALNVSAAVAQTGGIIIPCLNTYSFGSSSVCASDPLPYMEQLASSSTLIYFALQAANNYIPVSGETFTLVIEGYLL